MLINITRNDRGIVQVQNPHVGPIYDENKR